MILTQIDLRTTFNSTYTEKFSPESWAVSEMYWSFLKDYDTPSIKKINIYLSDDWENSLTKPMQVKGFKEAFIDFDFIKYFSLDKFERKKMQLEAIHKGMMEVAELEKWEKLPLVEAYNACLGNNLEYHFFLGKPKLSPDKKPKLNFWCNWDIDIFEAYWVLYDSKDNEVKRKKFIEKSLGNGEFIYYTKWKWQDNNKVHFVDNYKYGNQEQWQLLISEK